MKKFKDNVIDFTNAVFTNGEYKNRLQGVISGCDEIVFCVGHPTKWTKLDVAIYELILKCSVLGAGQYGGVKSTLAMVAESRAAFLYARNQQSFQNLKADESILVVDVGSSTVDLTAMQMTAVEYQYNSGNNYLGARAIDFIIREYYLEQIREDAEALAEYTELWDKNPSVLNSVALACRKAKEEAYTDLLAGGKGKASIYPPALSPVRLNVKKLEELIEGRPLRDVLQSELSLPTAEYSKMGNMNWKQVFAQFLSDEKAKMTQKGIKVGAIIMTGSASKMPFVPEILRQVFHEVSESNLRPDMDPSRSISKGLALFGQNNLKAAGFEEEVQHLLDVKLPDIIEKNVPSLGQKSGEVIEKMLRPVIQEQIQAWKNGTIRTINDMNGIIERACSEEKLSAMMQDSKEYKEVLLSWLKDEVARDVALELQSLCNQYNVRGFSLENLNIMVQPDPSIPGVSINTDAFSDLLAALIGAIAGLITGMSVVYILAAILTIISFISTTLVDIILTGLAAMGPAGITIIGIVLGVSVAWLIKNGITNADGGFLKSLKSRFQEKVAGFDLPSIARNLMTPAKINRALDDAHIATEIRKAFDDQDVKTKLVAQVSKELRGQVQERAEMIKYNLVNK